MTQTAFSPNYSSEDIRQILTIAMSQESSTSTTQLKEMAAELSIDEVNLSYAMEIWQAQKAEKQKKQQRRQQFYRQELLPYLAVSAFLVLLDISIAGTITWSVYPLFGWGIGLLLSVSPTNCKCRRVSTPTLERGAAQ